jgi:hypothetical protein
MKNPLKLAASLLALGMKAGASTPNVVAVAQDPSANYWHLWTDKQGTTHLTQCVMDSFVLQTMNKPAAPQWQDRRPGNGHVIFTVQPPHWNGAWHEDPRVQWVVPLKGTWFVEAQDGTRVEMGPGVPFLGEDQNSKPDAQGRRGHLAGNVGDGPVTLMVVQLDVTPTVGEPCHFK